MDKRKSGEYHECSQDDRMEGLEKTATDHEVRLRGCEKTLAEGDSRFTKIECGLAMVSEKLGELSDSIKSAVRWVLVSCGTLAIGALAYVLKIMPS